MVSNSKEEDSIVFYYSGHGSQIPNFASDEEKDQKDEVLCPHDMDFGNNFIRDSDLAEIFSRLPGGVNLEVILDCFHSGTGTREIKINLTSNTVVSNPAYTTLEELNGPSVQTPRYMEPPFDISFHLDYNPNIETNWLMSPLERQNKREIVLDKLNHTLWAGCRDEQLSYETDIEGIKRGIFTYHMCQILRKNNGDIERQKLFKLLNAAIQRMGYSQNPQLETSTSELKDKTFF